MALIPFEEGVGIPPSAEPKAAAPAASKKLISFEEGLGIPYPKKDPSILGALTDSSFWGDVGSRIGTGTLAIGDMIAGIPGQALTVGADLGVRAYALGAGESRRITDMAVEEAHAMIPQELSMPLQTLNKLITGAEPADQSGINDAIDAAAGALEKVTKNKISAGGAKSLLNTFMLVGGAKAGDAIIQQALTKADVKLPNARASYQAAETPEAMPVEPKGGPLDIMDSKAKVNELFKKAKQGEGLNVPDAAAVNEMFNRVRRGEDAPREPLDRGGNGKGPPAPEVVPPDPNRIGAQAGEVPKTRLTDPVIIGEEAPKPYSAPDIESALTKVQNGQGFSLTAEERISLTKLKQDAKGRFVDQYGKPLAIAAATAAALSQLDDLTDEQKVMGVLGATMVPREARSWGSVSEALRPYTFPSLDNIGKGATEISKVQIEQRLKDPKIPEAERAIIQRVLGATPGEKIYAADLAAGLMEETSGLTLTPKVTEQYADYGLDRIDRDASRNWGQDSTITPPANTTLYKLPEGSPVDGTANHFSEPDLFGWTRSFREEGQRHVVELQSDLAQHAKGALEPAEYAQRLKDTEYVAKQLDAMDEHNLVSNLSADNVQKLLEKADAVNPDFAFMFAQALADLPGVRAFAEKLNLPKNLGDAEWVVALAKEVDKSSDFSYGEPQPARPVAFALKLVYQTRESRLNALLGEHQAALNATAISSQLSPIMKNWPRRLIREELLDETRHVAKVQATIEKLEKFRDAPTEESWRPNELREHREVYQKHIDQLKAEIASKTVRFADADTVAKVEGWPEKADGLEQALAEYKENIAAAKDTLADPVYAERAKGSDEVRFPDHPYSSRQARIELEHARNELQVSTRQLERLEQQAANPKIKFEDPGHQSIYDRYSGEITRYLKGLGGKHVIDKEGHGWYEVPLKAIDTPRGPMIKMLGNSDPKALAAVAGAATVGLAAAGGMLPGIEKSAPRVTPFVGPKPGAPTTLASAGLANELAYKMTPEVERATIAQFRDNPAGSPAREKAATALYNENHRQVARAINSYAKAGIDLEEIVQHSFVKAFRTLEQKPEEGGFRGDSRFSTYLHTIATNLAKNAYKRGNPLKLEELTDEHADSVADPQARTPLQELQNKALAARMQRAIERLPDEFRETFTMKELEGMSNQEIAQKLGVPEGTVASRLSRATQRLQKDLREFADGQSGKADPRVVAGIAALGGGAAAGAWLSDSEPLRGAMYGTLIGAALGTSGGRTLLKNVIASPDKALGLISTRLANIDPSLRLAIVKHEKSVLQNLDRTNDQIFPFIKALDDLPKGVSEQVSRALLNGDLAAVNAVPELRVTYPAVAKALAGIKGELQALNRFGEGVVDYFPRLVKDLEGLKKHLGTIYSEGIEKALLAAEASMIKKEGRSLTDVEQSLVVNRFLFASDRSAFQPGYAKGRKIEEITPDLQKYYEPPTESLLRYVSGALTDIQTAKFFGKDLATRKQGGKSYNDVDSSIGNLVARLQREGNLTREQGVELRDILKARFEGGDKGMSSVLAHARNLTNTALLGNIASAATQLGDSLLTVYHHGAVPTIQALAQQLIGKQKITAKQLGLINHVAEELAGQSTTGAVLQKTLKYSGFMAIDMFAKGLNLNAGLIKNTKLAQTAAGQQLLWDRYGRAFGDEMPQLIEDLKARRMSDNVETLAFSEIADAQPISKAEMPEAYLNHPNGRILYQLKTYMLKQVDIVRRDAYQKIASGEPSAIMEGSKNLAALAAVYALANVPGDVVKDILSGRDIDPFTTPQLVDNVLQTFGLNRYTQDSLSKGKVVETAQNLLTPPLRVFQDIGKTVNSLLGGGSDYKGASYIPLAGRPVYERYLGGNERKEIAEKRLANSKLPKEERKPFSPEAKAYLQKKRLEKARDLPYESPAERKQRAVQARIDKRSRGEGK